MQLYNVAKISLPQIMTTVSFQITNLTSTYFIGHIHDKVAMAAIGMGYVIIGSFCMAFCFGLNGTLESKVSQAFGS